MTNRLIELEIIAKERFIDNSDWLEVIKMLDEKELEEYTNLRNKGTVSIRGSD